jgi:hypothetical protein
MELVGTLFATIAATAGAATATLGSTLLTGAQVLGTAFTALSTIGAGVAAKNESKSQAMYEDFQAKDTRIKADLDASEISKTLALTLQRNQVAAAAGGVDLGSQSVQRAQAQVTQDAERSLGMSNLNMQRSVLESVQRKRRVLQAGKLKLTTSLFDAGAGALSSAVDIAQRG